MGNKCILVMIDVFTKYLVAVALPDQLARRVVDTLLHRWILLFGVPRRILFDQGVNFESAVFPNLGMSLRIEKVRTSSYHPTGNGVCERVNQTIKKGLSNSLNEEILKIWMKPSLTWSSLKIPQSIRGRVYLTTI